VIRPSGSAVWSSGPAVPGMLAAGVAGWPGAIPRRMRAWPGIPSPSAIRARICWDLTVPRSREMRLTRFWERLASVPIRIWLSPACRCNSDTRRSHRQLGGLLHQLALIGGDGLAGPLSLRRHRHWACNHCPAASLPSRPDRPGPERSRTSGAGCWPGHIRAGSEVDRGHCPLCQAAGATRRGSSSSGGGQGRSS
jgi:hypothetical protein